MQTAVAFGDNLPYSRLASQPNRGGRKMATLSHSTIGPGFSARNRAKLARSIRILLLATVCIGLVAVWAVSLGLALAPVIKGLI
jgi:hypothetical protein